MTRKFSIKSKVVPPCPECQNDRHFVARSEQVAEDLCEVWVTCHCGFDPTENRTGSRMEDVWGSVDPDNIVAAMAYCWTELLREPTEAREGHEAR